MKQILIILAFLTASAGNIQAKESSAVHPIVLKSFEKTFVNACEVNWVSNGEIYIAEFKFNSQYITAYYSTSGRLLALRKNILSTELPVLLENSLKQDYKGYWITGLMEFGNQGETTYYVTLEDANQRIILKSSFNNWSQFHKSLK